MFCVLLVIFIEKISRDSKSRLYACPLMLNILIHRQNLERFNTHKEKKVIFLKKKKVLSWEDADDLRTKGNTFTAVKSIHFIFGFWEALKLL